MDDQEFDNKVRKKLANYEDVGFEPSALAGLHARLDAEGLMPWHLHYRTGISALSGFTVGVLVMMAYLYYTGATERVQQERNELLASQQEELSHLRNEIRELSNAVPDTIWITTAQQDVSNQVLLNRIAQLRRAVALSSPSENDQDHSHDTDITGSISVSTFRYAHGLQPQRLVPRDQKGVSLRAIPDNELTQHGGERDLSAKTIRDLERHYMRGIGIRIGPTVEASLGLYPQAEGSISLGLGLLADFIVSPSLSLETGAKYTRRYYEIDALNQADLPGVDQSLGEFEVAEIDSWTVEIPINLKYRYPVTTKTRLLAGVGYSPMLYYKQVFEYDYHLRQNNNFTIASIHQDENVQLYAGTLNLSVGLSYELKNKKIIETSLYYQHSLSDAGIENITPRYFGIRGVYWFKVR
jgi:hypothetical protein